MIPRPVLSRPTVRLAGIELFDRTQQETLPAHRHGARNAARTDLIREDAVASPGHAAGYRVDVEAGGAQLRYRADDRHRIRFCRGETR